MYQPSSTLLRWALGATVAVASLSTAPPAHAQPYCVPSASGVPGQPGVPNWWNVAPPAPLNDPRWRGSMGVGHTADHAQFRALRQSDGGNDYLVLSWHVKTDPGFADVGDTLFVGFYNEDSATPANSKGNIIRIERTGTATVAGGGAGSDFSVSMLFSDSTTSGGWNPVGGAPPVPAWLTDDARMDITCDGMAPPTCDEWAVRLRVLLNPAGTTDATGASAPTAGIPVGTNFKMFWDLQVGTPGFSPDHHKWPSTVSDVNEASAPPSYPPVAEWTDFQSNASPPCMAGVSIDRNNIDVENTPSTGSAHQINVAGTNTFHARPVNNTGAPLGSGAIKAHFRVADWGSSVGDSPSWRTIPGTCNAATGTGPDIGIGANWDLTCTWSLSAEDQCAYDPANFSSCTPMPTQRYTHQCVLVELSSTTVPVFFSRDSAYRNMDFITASEFERDARIDIGGLDSIGAPERDVYLYVQTRNMPADIEDLPPADQGDDGSDDDGSDDDGSPANGDAQEPDNDNRGGREGTDNDAQGANKKVNVKAALQVARKGGVNPAKQWRLKHKLRPGIVGQEAAKEIEQAVSSGTLTHQDVAQIMPTLQVHVWHDTGKKVDGKPVLEPQPSFGYFIAHDGPLLGWLHELVGKGVSLTQVANARNFYKVSVPEGGSIEVTTRITSVEEETKEPPPKSPIPPKSPRPWMFIILVLLMIIILMFLRSQGRVRSRMK